MPGKFILPARMDNFLPFFLDVRGKMRVRNESSLISSFKYSKPMQKNRLTILVQHVYFSRRAYGDYIRICSLYLKSFDLMKHVLNCSCLRRVPCSTYLRNSTFVRMISQCHTFNWTHNVWDYHSWVLYGILIVHTSCCLSGWNDFMWKEGMYATLNLSYTWDSPL